MPVVDPRLIRLAITALLGVLVCAGAALAHDSYAPRTDPLPAPATTPATSGRYTLLVEGFEDAFPPTGWARLTSGQSYQWEQTAARAHSGFYSAWVHYGPQGYQQDEWLVTPALDLTSATMPALEFWEDEADWSSYGDHHYIAVSTTSQTDPAAFTMIETWTPANHPIDGFAGDPVYVDLGAFAGEPVVYVAFRYTGVWADDWYVADVRIFEPFDHDVKAVSAAPIGELLSGGDTIDPEAVVANVGLNPEAFDVRLESSGSGTVVYSETAAVAALAPGAQTTLSFPSLTLDAGNYYKLIVTTLLAGDEDPSNDVAKATNWTYTEPHVPVGFLFTNSGCSPCAPANVALDDFMATAGNTVALLRVHTWWPYGGDIMWLANEEQNTALTNEYGVTGVPHFFVDRFDDLDHTPSVMVAGFDEARSWTCPMSIELVWDDPADQLTVTIHHVNPLDPDGDYRLYCAITEDNIYHNGGNGEPIHMQAFRYMYPDCYDGIAVPSTSGWHEFIVDCPLYSTWVYEELRASVYVIDRAIGRIWQGSTGFLTELSGTTGIEPSLVPEARTALGPNVPNPFPAATRFMFTLDTDTHVRLSIYGVTGRLIDTVVNRRLAAGEHSIPWNRESVREVTSAGGIYFYRLEAGGIDQTRKMVVLPSH